MKRNPLHLSIEQAEANEGIMWLCEHLRGKLSFEVDKGDAYVADFLDARLQETRQMNPLDNDHKPAKYHLQEALIRIWWDKAPAGSKWLSTEMHIPAYSITQVEGTPNDFTMRGKRHNLHFTRLETESAG